VGKEGGRQFGKTGRRKEGGARRRDLSHPRTMLVNPRVLRPALRVLENRLQVLVPLLVPVDVQNVQQPARLLTGLLRRRVGTKEGLKETDRTRKVERGVMPLSKEVPSLRKRPRSETLCALLDGESVEVLPRHRSRLRLTPSLEDGLLLASHVDGVVLVKLEGRKDDVLEVRHNLVEVGFGGKDGGEVERFQLGGEGDDGGVKFERGGEMRRG
jgi:hypothetical protein